jgi:hypothetical protein
MATPESNKRPGRKTVESYITHGHYDKSKSERRRREIKQAFTTDKFTPKGVSTEEYLRQRAIRQSEAINKLMTIVMKAK